MGHIKEVNLHDLSDIIKRHSHGETFHTKVTFDLKGRHAVTLELLEQLYPGSREDLIDEIISAGLNEHMEMVAPILQMIKFHGIISEGLDNETESEDKKI